MMKKIKRKNTEERDTVMCLKKKKQKLNEYQNIYREANKIKKT